MSPIIQVECSLPQCVYYTTKPSVPDPYCNHPKKRDYMSGDRCPLYKLDWSKATGAQEALRKRFGIP